MGENVNRIEELKTELNRKISTISEGYKSCKNIEKELDSLNNQKKNLVSNSFGSEEAANRMLNSYDSAIEFSNSLAMCDAILNNYFEIHDKYKLAKSRQASSKLIMVPDTFGGVQYISESCVLIDYSTLGRRQGRTDSFISDVASGFNGNASIKSFETVTMNSYDAAKYFYAAASTKLKSLTDQIDKLKKAVKNIDQEYLSDTMPNYNKLQKLDSNNLFVKEIRLALNTISDIKTPNYEKLREKKVTLDKIKKLNKQIEDAQKKYDACRDTILKYDRLTNKLNAINTLSSETRYNSDLFVQQSASGKFSIKTKMVQNGYSNEHIEDIRNLNGKNFRTQSFLKDDGQEIDLSLLSEVQNNGKVSPSRTFYMNQNYLFTNSLNAPSPLNGFADKNYPEIQKLYLNEFQPDPKLTLKDILPAAVDKVIGAAGTAMGNAIGNVIGNIAKYEFFRNQIDSISKDPSLLYDRTRNTTSTSFNGRRQFFTSDPVTQVQNMFMGGKWLNTYELPFFGGDYLKSNTSSNWSIGNAKEYNGETISTFTDLLGIDFPANPKFKISSISQATRPQISTTFYLLNSNNEWLKRNFEFVQAIFAGTSWLHMKYCTIQSPNVYYVLCPGRFQMLYAVMDITITFEGKLRKIPSISNLFNKYGIGSIDNDMLWPDAWKVDIILKDLTPNNFNMYAEFYQKGYDYNELKILANGYNIKDIVYDISNYTHDVANDFYDTAKTTIETVKNSVDTVWDGVKNSFIAKAISEEGTIDTDTESKKNRE